MSEHTPTPWYAHQNQSRRTLRAVKDDIYIGSFDYGVGRETMIANAEFTVRAVNSHDDLIAALNAIAEGCSFPENDVQRAIRDRARAAIAKAKEGR